MRLCGPSTEKIKKSAKFLCCYIQSVKKYWLLSLFNHTCTHKRAKVSNIFPSPPPHHCHRHFVVIIIIIIMPNAINDRNHGNFDAILDEALDELGDDDDDDDNGNGKGDINHDDHKIHTVLPQSEKDVQMAQTSSWKDIQGSSKASNASDQNNSSNRDETTSTNHPTPPSSSPSSQPGKSQKLSSPASSLNDTTTMQHDTNDEMTAASAAFQSMLREFIEAEDDGNDPDVLLGQFMQKIQSELASSSSSQTTSPSNHAKPNISQPNSSKAKAKAKAKPSSKSPSATSNQSTSHNNNPIDATISALLEDMAKASVGNGPNIPHNNDDDDDEDDDDNAWKEMFRQFQQGGEHAFDSQSFNPDAVIDGMMEQLLSKDIMYEPMKQVTEKFPQWLHDHKPPKLAKEDYDQ